MSKIRVNRKFGIFALCLIWSLAAVTAVWAADPVVVELHYQNGIKYYRRGLYDKAIQEFEKTLSLDPQNQDARIYLQKVQLIKKNQTAGDVQQTRDTEAKELTRQAKEFYKTGQYQEAIDTFNKVLEIKPIDEYASFYKERSEIFLSRKLAREKKIQNKQALKEARQKAKEDKIAEKKELALKRKEARHIAGLPAKAENRESLIEHDLASYETESESRAVPQGEGEPLLNKKEQIRQDRLAEKERKRQEKLQTKEDKKKEAQDRVAAKKAVAADRKQAKIDKQKEEQFRKQEAREEKRQARIDSKKALRERKKIEREHKQQEAVAKKESIQLEKEQKKTVRKETAQERAENKQLFLRGVELYSRRQYDESIAAFNEVIQKEDEAKTMIYSNTAKRMMQKAQERLKGVGKDENIEPKMTAE